MTDDGMRRLLESDRFNAFVAFCAAGNGLPAGRLGGCAIGVKDNIAVSGMPFTAGHPLFAGRIADADAEVVRRLKNAGGMIVGVTRTDAGGFGVTTPSVVNPLAPDRTAGGSSGGGAAAVAAGLVALAVGTDTGGSVRIPAACCGLYGFKPTWSRELLDGVWPLAPQFDHVGLMARSLDLIGAAALALQASDQPRRDAVSAVGIDFEQLGAAAPAIRVAILALGKALESAGYSVRPINLPNRAMVAEAHGVLVLAAARDVYREFALTQMGQLASIARRSLAAAEALDAATVQSAEVVARRLATNIEHLFGTVDVVLTPTLLVEPPLRNARRIVVGGREMPVVAALVAETCLANMTGCPALAIPGDHAGRPSGAIPVSYQIMTARGGDRRLLEFAGVVERLIMKMKANTP